MKPRTVSESTESAACGFKMMPETGTDSSPARSTVNSIGRVTPLVKKPPPAGVTPSWSASSRIWSTVGTTVAPSPSDATSRPPSSSSGTDQACSGLTGATSRSGVISRNPVTIPPAALVARTVIRTGTSAQASGSARMVSGTSIDEARPIFTSGWSISIDQA